MAVLNKVRKARTVTEKTYKKLVNAIASNRFLPGEQLVAETLANELGVSRTPVRDALLMLEQEGLVEVVTGVGVFVKGLELDDLLELFEFREVIERFAISKMAVTPNSDLLKQLRKKLESFGDLVDLKQVNAAADADLEFHHALVVATGNVRMKDTWEMMATQLRRFWVDGRLEPARAQADVHECLLILAALESGDEAEALRRLQEHLASTRQSLIDWRQNMSMSS